jgi:hypothetical protein
MIISGNQRTNPRWLADFGADRDHMEVFPAKLNPSAWANSYGIDIQVAGAAIQGATSVSIVAAQAPLPSVQPVSSLHQQLLPKGQAILLDPLNAKIAVLNAPLYQGDTTLSVLPLPTALAGTEDCKVSLYGNVYVQDGQLAGRNWNGVDGDVSAQFVPALIPDSFVECYLIQFPVTNLYIDNNVEFVRSFRGVTVKKNYLPNYALMAADPGIADPTVAPVLSVAGTDGPVAAGLWTVQRSYGNAFGETKPSPAATITTTTTQHITVADAGAFPTNATYMKIYVSPAPGVPGTLLQGVQAAHAAYNILTAGTGNGPRSVNNSKSGYGLQLDFINKA